jgi:hypothetical protein
VKRKFGVALGASGNASAILGIGVWTADMVDYGSPGAVSQDERDMWNVLPVLRPINAQMRSIAQSPSFAEQEDNDTTHAGEEEEAAAAGGAGGGSGGATAASGVAVASGAAGGGGGGRVRLPSPVVTKVVHRTKAASPAAASAAASSSCQANVCVAPKKEVFYPASPSLSYTATAVVPELPKMFLPEQSTIYYYFNLIPENLKGYGHFNQFVVGCGASACTYRAKRNVCSQHNILYVSTFVSTNRTHPYSLAFTTLL